MSDKCPFCGEPAVRITARYTIFRCGTKGPDAEGNYETGYACDITTFGRLVDRLTAENEKLRRENDELSIQLSEVSDE